MFFERGCLSNKRLVLNIITSPRNFYANSSIALKRCNRKHIVSHYREVLVVICHFDSNRFTSAPCIEEDGTEWLQYPLVDMHSYNFLGTSIDKLPCLNKIGR